MSNKWKFWFCIGIAFAVLCSVAVPMSAAGVCERASKAFGDEIAKAANCAEFWFNRYQSLLGNVLTAGVAGATLLWIARQLEVSNRESAISAASALRTRIAEIHLELDFVAKVELRLTKGFAAFGKDALSAMTDAGARASIIEMSADAHQSDDEFEVFLASRMENSVSKTDSDLRTALVRWGGVMERLQLRFVFEGQNIEQFFRDNEAEAKKIMMSVVSAAAAHKFAQRDELVAVWNLVRRLEARALAGVPR